MKKLVGLRLSDPSVVDLGELRPGDLVLAEKDGKQGRGVMPVSVAGPSAYEVAVANGFVGTVTQWLESLVGPPGDEGPPGNEVELRKTATHVQWRYVGEAWADLIALSELKGDEGDQGAPGQEVSLQKTATHIQWRLGAGAWVDLVALSELKGDQGDQGEPGVEVELQKSATHIQWRYVGGTWADLVALSELKGDPGDLGIPTWITATSTLTKNAYHKVDFTAPRTLTLPASPVANDFVEIMTDGGDATGSVIDRNGATIMDLAENLNIDVAVLNMRLTYTGTTWRITV